MKYKTLKTEELFEAGVHIGHQAKRWHPKMEPYIYSAENKVHVFDLEQTAELLKEAQDFLFETAKTGGQIIFVGTKRQASSSVKEAAVKSGALYIIERWLGGTMTNFRMIKRNMEKLVSLIKKREDGSFAKYTKKERLLIDREIEKLERYVGGIVSLKGTPAAIVVIDPRKEKTVVREALRSNVPVVAMIDTNSDPTAITYPIPGNDDAIKSIKLVIDSLADAVAAGYKEFADLATSASSVQTSLPQAGVLEVEMESVKTPLIVKSDVKEEILPEKELPKLVETTEEIIVEPIKEVLAKEIVEEKKFSKTKRTKAKKLENKLLNYEHSN